jgi:hypothetical protein
MTLLPLSEQRPVAVKLNAILAQIYADRGVPDHIHVDYSRQSLILHYPAIKLVIVHPLPL